MGQLPVSHKQAKPCYDLTRPDLPGRVPGQPAQPRVSDGPAHSSTLRLGSTVTEARRPQHDLREDDMDPNPAGKVVLMRGGRGPGGG